MLGTSEHSPFGENSINSKRGEKYKRQFTSKLDGIKQDRPALTKNEADTTFLGNRTQSENRDTLNKDEAVMKRNGNTNRFSIGTIITKYWNGLPYKGIVTSNTDKYYYMNRRQ